ncbi:MAG: aminopeptidase P family protein [Lachnospiraceae bacterium]|nr:aminopeptidase P family protein [Lachnospiraceae bacterium]
MMFREKMAETNTAVYIVPTADFHESEYVGDYFKARAFLTGFSGSAGTAVVTQDSAVLFTDGRYFIQAERELEGSGFTLMRMGEKDVPTLTEYVRSVLPPEGVIGFDGRTMNAAEGEKLLAIAEEKGGSLSVSEDLVDQIWPDRPQRARSRARVLSEEYAGETVQEKIARIRAKMKEYGAAIHILTTLDDIAWLLNIRGSDVRHWPVVLSYLMLTEKGCVLYISGAALTDEVKKHLAENRVSTAPYEDIYKIADMLNTKHMGTVLLDKKKVNYRIVSAVSGANEILDRPNPTVLMKAVKNETEIRNIRAAHVKDGVAMVRWLYWLKNTIGTEELTEINASDRLEQFRREQEGFVDLSFGTIAAYRDNAAMMHYSAKEESAAVLQPEHFLLVDSGGHYLEGSTDITRTVALGPLTEREKELFTTVLRSNLNLAAAKFLYGCTGQNLDVLARGPLWELGLDYKCGTGHGIGYLLNVHEAPNGFRWKQVAERNDSAVFEAGMVTTDEPGVYIEGELGIRTENELLCVKAEENEYGQFMEFECVTLCPIDLEAVIPAMLTKREKKLLNDYHEKVYQELSPYLPREEQLWLRYQTREV